MGQVLMARFEDSWLSELYAKNDIVDVVGGYVTLSERGGRYWGLCPFHHEKTPSFSVSRDKQLYYCFGCKAGGNATNFLMKAEKVSFSEAVEMLARRARMEMPQAMDDQEYRQLKDKRQAIAQMNKLAAQHYFDTLHGPQGAEALRYLKRRGVEEPVIRRFGLGYAPDAWESLTELLKKNGFSDSLIRESGLVSIKDSRMYDAFRGRVMFPIINVFGEVIAFGGRVLDSSQPKYLNTRDTALFNKRKNLYGISLVRKLKSVKSVVIVEGYMDVVSMQAQGVKAVVASLGTALTREQAVLLKRYTNTVFIAYDGDEAGEAATQKAITVLGPEGFDLRVIRFDADVDPDDFIRKYGLGGFAKKVREALTATDYRLDVAKRPFDLKTENGREGYALAAAGVLRSIESPIQRERYAARVAEETGYSSAAILDQVTQTLEPKENIHANYRNNSTRTNADEAAEEAFLACALAYPEYFAELAEEIGEDDFTKSEHKNIFSALYDCAKRGIQPAYAELLSQLEREEDAGEAARLAGLDAVAQDPAGLMRDCASRMRQRRIERRRGALREALKEATGDEKRRLLAEIGRLDKELNLQDR
jgi:DNA primase